ncbi:hypothetical protein HDV05_001867 [Chytridiales sp. JEL 0842]|nr:hypothetical protein HDV05_001867 [Chytridiales sp. JEL 0842]
MTTTSTCTLLLLRQQPKSKPTRTSLSSPFSLRKRLSTTTTSTSVRELQQSRRASNAEKEKSAFTTGIQSTQPKAMDNQMQTHHLYKKSNGTLTNHVFDHYRPFHYHDRRYPTGKRWRKAHVGLLASDPRFKPTQMPIVLCHGLFGYGELGPKSLPFLQLKYWSGISDALRHLGCEVYIPHVGMVASVRTRAKNLQRFLEENLEGREVNLIAHSMGGLDSRYLISHLPSPMFKVASLTTIATPHRGSTFMDFLRDTLGLGELHRYYPKEDPKDPVTRAIRESADNETPEDQLEREWRAVVRTAAKKHPLLKSLCAKFDKPAFANLTTEYCEIFNNVTMDDPNVHYSSYAAVTDVPKLAPLHIPYRVIKQREGPNDGLVSLTSAKWGDFEGLAGDVDHWDLIPPKIKGLSQLTKVFESASATSSGMLQNLSGVLSARFQGGVGMNLAGFSGIEVDSDGDYSNQRHGQRFSSHIKTDNDIKDKDSFDSREFYLKVATRLAEKGY